MLGEGLEGIEDLAKVLDDLLLGELALLAHLGQHVAVIAILHHEVEMVCGFLDGVELDDVRVVAGLQDLDFVLEEFVELACIARGVPLMVSRLMALIATSCLVC